MEPDRTVLKEINGKKHSYDRITDRIDCYGIEGFSKQSRNLISDSVDLCIEITDSCNLSCINCFSSSMEGKNPSYNTVENINKIISDFRDRVIRICITGGEPLLHPDIDELLELPLNNPDVGFVLGTNGTLHERLDSAIIKNNWSTAVSLQGNEQSHNWYTKSKTQKQVKKRIQSLASQSIVYIYTVVHNELTEKDVDWLYCFRDKAKVGFLRFLKPRPFGRYKQFENSRVLDVIEKSLDSKSSLTSLPSNTIFVCSDGTIRKSN